MRFSASALSALAVAAGVALNDRTASAFVVKSTTFVRSATSSTTTSKSNVGCTKTHNSGCNCPNCAPAVVHSAGCPCHGCARSNTRLNMMVEVPNEAPAGEVTDVPPEIEAIDGIESEQEAHNEQRMNNRGSLQKHKREPEGDKIAVKDLEVGSMVSGKVKSIASYGAFIDLGAQTDGLLHISALSTEFVSDVKDFLTEGQEVEVRIVSADTEKNQIQLSLLKEGEEAAPRGGGGGDRGGGGGRGGPSRNEKMAVQNKLLDAGWSPDEFVEGEVVNTLDFGAFIDIDVSKLNSELEGTIDGLCHISCLAAGRTNAVSDVVKAGDKVQVRLKSIQDGKVALSLISADEESAERSERRGGGGGGGGKGGRSIDSFFEQNGPSDWQEQLDAMGEGDDAIMSGEFFNGPLIVDKRK